MMELRYGKVATEAKDYLPIRIIDEFLNKDSSDSPSETIDTNCECVKQETLRLIVSEMERIKNNANLSHIIKE